MGGDAAPPGRIDACVVGASAGGVEALQRFVALLPADLPIPVIVALHMLDEARSMLPAILDRQGPLACVGAVDGAAPRPGVVHVATPGSHLLVEPGRLRLSAGPPDHFHRPAIDLLFRSAAETYGARVAGVVLSGSREDGSAGLACIRDAGGPTLVQDPHEAQHAGMPEAAIRHIDDAFVGTIAALATEVADLAGASVRTHAATPCGPEAETA